MEPIRVVRWGIGLVCAGYAARTWLKKRQVRNPRELKEVPRARVADAVSGRVRLEGVVAASAPLVLAAFTRSPCIAYEVMIEFRFRHGLNSFVRLLGAAAFSLDDGSGTVAVEIGEDTWQPIRRGPAGLSVVVPPHVSSRARPGRGEQREIDWLLLFHGLSRTSARHVVVSESIVRDGDRVAIVGSASPQAYGAGVESVARYCLHAHADSLIIGPAEALPDRG